MTFQPRVPLDEIEAVLEEILVLADAKDISKQDGFAAYLAYHGAADVLREAMRKWRATRESVTAARLDRW